MLDTEGGTPTTPVTARLWQLRSVQDGQDLQDEQGTDAITVRRDNTTTLDNPGTFSFVRDGNFADVGKDVGLSIQDTPRVANDTGWLFRSSAISGGLPTDPIEIITATQTITPAGLPGLLPATPITQNGATITSLTATLAGPSTSPPMRAGIDLVAAGTATVANIPAAFVYTGRLVLIPSPAVGRAHRESLVVEFDNPSIMFSSLPGSGPVGGILSDVTARLAFILNVFQPFVLDKVTPGMLSTVTRQINSDVAAKVGRSLPGGVLPEGVYLSIRSVSVSSTSMVVRGAVGAFGGVIAKLPPSGGGGGGGSPFKCSYTALAVSGYALSGFSLLRSIRGTRLSTSETGRRLTELYYRCGPEVISLLRADRALAARTAAAANELTELLRQAGPIPAASRLRYEGMLRELAARGTTQLRAAVNYTLNADVWRLLRG